MKKNQRERERLEEGRSRRPEKERREEDWRVDGCENSKRKLVRESEKEEGIFKVLSIQASSNW